MNRFGWYWRLVVIVAMGLLALVLDAGPAAGAANTVSVSPAVIPAGGTVTVSGSIAVAQCPESDGVTLTATAALFPPDGFGPTIARNASGAFSTNVTVPASTPPGSYSIGLRCGGGNVGVVAQLQVTAQVSSVPSAAPQAGLGGASRSEGPPLGWLVAGVTLLLMGMAGFVVWRRRTTG